MFIALTDAPNWVVFYEDKNLNPRRVCCWAIKEYTNNNRKVIPIVHGQGGKMVDANSIGKISALLAGKSATERMMAAQIPEGDTMPEPQPEPQPPIPDPVPEFEDDE